MKFIKILLITTFFCTILGLSTIFGVYIYLKPSFPDISVLQDVQLQTPMQVYTQDKKLISQFGEKRRIPLKLREMPELLVKAVIATEDRRFYEHYGVDPVGILRAITVALISGHTKQGASTITQQLARNFFLSNKRKLIRKVKEVFIAIHIEQLLNKDEILELYLNKIYLGHRAYGIGAAAQVYFGKEVNDLTLGEIAIIAGLPKAPSTMNPIYSVDRARTRRNVVLMRMRDENFITQAEYEAARSEEIVARYHGAEIEVSAPYVAELARDWAVKKYGEGVYTSGIRVYTTIQSKLQTAANQAIVSNLLEYDEGHGYRGATKEYWAADEAAWTEEKIKKALKSEPIYGQIYPAVVTGVDEKTVQVYIKRNGLHTLDWDGLKWARAFKSDNLQGPVPKLAGDILSVGEQIWVREDQVREAAAKQKLAKASAKKAKTKASTEEQTDDQLPKIWKLSQIPVANSALASIKPETGAMLALVGGFNYVHNKFNRATQSIRQVGSSMKPFIYSAAIDKGLTLATLINDAPINKWDASAGTVWRPKNSPPIYRGPTRLRKGLAQSINVMAVRVLRKVGLHNMLDYLTKFGFDRSQLPKSEVIALGAGSLTPLQVAQGFAVFANGGHYLEPYYIDRAEGPFGQIKFETVPAKICRKKTCSETQYPATDMFDPKDSMLDLGLGTDDVEREIKYAKRVISEQTAFLVREMLISNIRGGGSWSHHSAWLGTGHRALVLNREDIGGKTGTTNDSKDTWYNGYGPGVVTSVWVGFDQHSRALGKISWNRNLSKNEQKMFGTASGGKTAQPAWIKYMKVALDGVPAKHKAIPPHITSVLIDRETGLRAHKNDYTSMFEYFLEGTEPSEYVADIESNEDVSEDEDEFLF